MTATADQLKALLKSYAEGDQERFLMVFMQVAAHAARRGHDKLATDLRGLIDDAREKSAVAKLAAPVPIARLAGELSDLFVASYPKTRLGDMVLVPEVRDRLQRVVDQYRQQGKLRARGYSARRKLLLVGPPGSGKTMTAAALAGELHLPLLAVRLDALITKFMGETAAKLRNVFEAITRTRGVYLFDEFDAIGGDRDRPNDVGEMRRVLNSFLQFLEADDSDSLILASTNHESVLDPALFRRFDDIVRYGLPGPGEIVSLIQNRLVGFGLADVDWEKIKEASKGLSYAELSRASLEAAKEAVLQDKHAVTNEQLLTALSERRQISSRGREE